MVTWGKYYWPYFLILVSSLFGIPEVIAIFTNRQNTLSAYSWGELFKPGFGSVHEVAWTASLVTWLVFVIVITLHIWFRKAY